MVLPLESTIEVLEPPAGDAPLPEPFIEVLEPPAGDAAPPAMAGAGVVVVVAGTHPAALASAMF